MRTECVHDVHVARFLRAFGLRNLLIETRHKRRTGTTHRRRGAARSSMMRADDASASLVSSSELPFPTDMEIDAEEGISLLEGHDAPAEKTDADFFNGVFSCRSPPRHTQTRLTRFAAVWCADFDDDFDDEDLS